MLLLNVNIKGRNVSKLLVAVGEWDNTISSELYPKKDIGVTKMIIHPNYNSDNLCNDLGLLVLAEDADLDQPHIGVACLPATTGKTELKLTGFYFLL